MKKLTSVWFVFLLAGSINVAAQQWILPQPWGNPVTDIEFVDDNIGLATVSYDGVYRTTDGGTTWTKVWDTGSDACLMIDCKPSGETVVACKTFLLYSQDFGATWQARGQLTDMTYLKIQLVAPQQLVAFIGLQAENGYAIGKSADAGQSWVTDTLTWSPYPWMREHYADISFETLQKGLVITDNGVLYTTQNGGKTLQKVNYYFATDENCKCAVMAPGCYLVAGLSSGKGEPLFYYTSHDAGATWNAGVLSEGVAPERIKVKEFPSVVMLYGRDGDLYPPVYVFYSADTGHTWQWKKIEKGISVRAFDIVPSGRAWAYENEGFYQLFSSTPSGNILALKAGTLTDDLACIQFAGQVGFALGTKYNSTTTFTSTVYRSENGGLSWDSLASVPGAPLHLSFCNEYTGLMAAGYGNSALYRTTDGGRHWAQLPHAVGEIKGLKLFPGGVTWLYNSTTLYRSGDYATTLVAMNEPVDMAWQGFFFLNENTLYAFGDQNGQGAISRSDDGGLTWQTRAFPIAPVILLRMVDAGEGLALTQAGAVYRLQFSTGQAVEIFNDTSLQVYDIAFSTTQQGYLLCKPAYNPLGPDTAIIFSTQDGGSTWLAYGPFWNLKRLESFYGMNGVAYGHYGRLMSLAMGYPLGRPESENPAPTLAAWVEGNELKIWLPDASAYREVRIYDLGGRCLRSEILKGENPARLKLAGLSRGIYLLELSGGQVSRLKFALP